nr:hypothetical protein CFP56_19888 [Quercus suber]
MKKFREANFVQIPREENVKADALVKEALAAGVMDEYDEVQYLPRIDLPEIQQIGNEENWMTPIVSYLKDGKLPKGKDEAKKLRVRAAGSILGRYCSSSYSSNTPAAKASFANASASTFSMEHHKIVNPVLLVLQRTK